MPVARMTQRNLEGGKRGIGVGLFSRSRYRGYAVTKGNSTAEVMDAVF